MLRFGYRRRLALGVPLGAPCLGRFASLGARRWASSASTPPAAPAAAAAASPASPASRSAPSPPAPVWAPHTLAAPTKSRRRARLEAEADARRSDKAAAGAQQLAAVRTSAAETTTQEHAHPEVRLRSLSQLLSEVSVLDPPAAASLTRACVGELLRRFAGEMDESAYVTCLEALIRETRGPDATTEARANHAMLIDVLRPALARGCFRLRSGSDTLRWLLQSLVASCDDARVVHLFDFLFVCMARDYAQALRKIRRPPPDRARWAQALQTRIELSGFSFTAAEDRLASQHTSLLHLDARCYECCMQAKLRLGLDQQVIALLHTLTEVAAMEEWLHAHAHNTDTHQYKGRHGVQPDAAHYLLAFQAACRSSRASLARDLFLQALRCAESDFASHAVRLYHAVANPTELLALSDDQVDRHLAHLDPTTHQRITAQLFHNWQQEQRHTPHALSPPAIALRPPSFLLFDHSVLELFIRSLHELALANFIGGAQSSEAVKTREAIGVLREYLANPVWFKLWLLDTPGSQSAAPAESQPASASPLQPANPCVGLELLLRVLESVRDYRGILSLFQSVLVPAIEAANQQFVRNLIRAGTLEAVGHPDQQNPAATFAASQRLKIRTTPTDNLREGQARHSQLDALFTVVTIPPCLQPPVAALSAPVYDSVANAYCHIALQSGVGSSIGRSHLPSARSSTSAPASDLSLHLFPFFRMIEARALMRTVALQQGLVDHYCSDRSAGMQERMRLYHETAIGLPELLSLMQRLPGNQWPVCVQLTDFVVRGAVVPCLIEEERMSARDASSHPPSAASASLPPVVRSSMSSSARQLVSPSSRSLLQSIYLELMSKLFSARKFPQILQLYEHDQRRYFSPPLPLSVEQSLLVLQSSAWVGNIEGALALLASFSPSYSASQRVMSVAFMVHFLETHVLKAIRKTMQRLQPNVIIGQTHNDTRPTHARTPDESSEDPFAALPAPSELPVPRVSSMGAPILSPTGGPAYRAQSGFTILPPWLGAPAGPAAVGIETADLQADAALEWRKVDAWKREAKARLTARFQGQEPAASSQPAPSSSPFPPVAPPSVCPSPLLFDAPEFLLAHAPTLARRTLGTHAVTGALFTEAPQGGTFSFGSGSPAFSSYATTTAQLATPDSGHPSIQAAQADPMIKWQLAQIEACIANLMRDPSAMWYDPTLRRCDLRSGVSYNLGRCLVYLLSLWIKSQTGPTRRYQFLLPRSILRINQTDDHTHTDDTAHTRGSPAQPAALALRVSSVAPSPSPSPSSSSFADASADVVLSDLEHVLLHSYSAEFLLSQYFHPEALSMRQVERSKRPHSAEWQGLLDAADTLVRQANESTEDATAAGAPPPSFEDDIPKRDAFGMPLSQQPFVIFTVKWP